MFPLFHTLSFIDAENIILCFSIIFHFIKYSKFHFIILKKKIVTDFKNMIESIGLGKFNKAGY